MKTTFNRLFLIASAAALTTACTGVWNGPEQAMTVAEEHPISVDTQVVTLTLDVAPGAGGLTSQDKARIRAFADSYLVSGHGPVTLTAPVGGGAEGAGAAMAAEARAYLSEVGVDYASISGSSYVAGQSGPRQIIISYTHYVATPSACGVWSGMRARDYSNLRSPNFGCATQNNLAAMVSDPRDLIQPADTTSADATARIRAMRAYRDGQVTSSATDGEIQAEIAN